MKKANSSPRKANPEAKQKAKALLMQALQKPAATNTKTPIPLTRVTVNTAEEEKAPTPPPRSPEKQPNEIALPQQKQDTPPPPLPYRSPEKKTTVDSVNPTEKTPKLVQNSQPKQEIQTPKPQQRTNTLEIHKGFIQQTLENTQKKRKQNELTNTSQSTPLTSREAKKAKTFDFFLPEDGTAKGVFSATASLKFEPPADAEKNYQPPK